MNTTTISRDHDAFVVIDAASRTVEVGVALRTAEAA